MSEGGSAWRPGGLAAWWPGGLVAWCQGGLNTAGVHPGLHVIGWSSDGDKAVTARHLGATGQFWQVAAQAQAGALLAGPLRELLPEVGELGIS